MNQSPPKVAWDEQRLNSVVSAHVWALKIVSVDCWDTDNQELTTCMHPRYTFCPVIILLSILAHSCWPIHGDFCLAIWVLFCLLVPWQKSDPNTSRSHSLRDPGRSPEGSLYEGILA
mmetsp:Transcript_96658/g.166611  ORF Transcript_96658/g.166611 Transcript_96658/m.166611 type:complete len:117 (+) Transcript_96658:2146-2496(+)